MRPSPEYLRETHLIGRRCRERALDSEHCPALRNAPFRWIGFSELRAPYRMVRLSSVHSHVVVCVAGEGRTLIDGEVRQWSPGQVLVAPVGAHHAFDIAGSGPWTLAWVFFADRASAPAIQVRQPELMTAETGDFVFLLQMLLREAAGRGQPAVLEPLVALLASSTHRLVGTQAGDQRLWRLWEKVESDLGHAWSVRELARLACVSEEHLRRLCLKHYQRSPMDHLTHLRMRRAGMLLRSSSEKVENISQHVGYGSAYSFSAAFRRWSGVPPGRYRRVTGSDGN